VIEATLRVWLTAEDDEAVDTMLDALTAAAQENPGAVVFHVQSRREVP